jgi:hypothetical protein
MSSKKDSQRSAVYKWEDEVFKTDEVWRKPNSMTLDQCERLANKVVADFMPEPVPVVMRDGRSKRRACYYNPDFAWNWRDYHSGTIDLPRWSRCPAIVLHEVTHHLVWWKYGANDNSPSAHGREFATLALMLYGKYCGIDTVEARKIGIKQRPRRVHFAKLSVLPKPIKRIYKLK